MVAQGGGIEGGFLFGGIGVDLAADALDMIDDLAGGVVLCAFEDAVLDVVRHAVFIGEFVTSSRADHDTDINDGRIGLAVDNLHAVGEIMIKSIAHIRLIYCLCGLPPSHKATLLYFRGHRPRYARPPRSYSRFMQPICSFFCSKVNFFQKNLAYVHFLLYLCSRFLRHWRNW